MTITREPAQPKSWWSRHWGWLVPLFLTLATLWTLWFFGPAAQDAGRWVFRPIAGGLLSLFASVAGAWLAIALWARLLTGVTRRPWWIRYGSYIVAVSVTLAAALVGLYALVALGFNTWDSEDTLDEYVAPDGRRVVVVNYGWLTQHPVYYVTHGPFFREGVAYRGDICALRVLHPRLTEREGDAPAGCG